MLSSAKISGWLLAFVSLLVLLGASQARADIYQITFFNVTFSATCIGGVGTCTEVVNGSGLYDSVAKTASGLSTINLTGSLNVPFNAYGNPSCGAPGCLGGGVLYDSGTLSGFNPIEFSPNLPTFDAPTPVALTGGSNGTLLFVPGACGGNQPNCNKQGAFPGGSNADYELISGTYTSVDAGPSPTPEPGSWTLLLCGFGLLAVLRRFRAGGYGVQS